MHGGRVLDRDLADLARRLLVPGLVDDRNMVTRDGEPHRPRLDRHPGEVRHQVDRLGLAVAVVDGEPEGLFPGLDDLGVQRLAGADAVAQVGDLVFPEVLLHEGAVGGRRGAQHGDFVFLDQREGPFRVEGGVDHQGGGPVVPGPVQDAPRGLRPAGPGDAPDEVRGPQVEPVLPGDPVGAGVEVVVHDRLRVPRGAGGVVDQRRVGGLVVHDLELRGGLCRLLVEGDPPFPLFADADEVHEVGAVPADLVHLGGLGVPADDGAGAGVEGPVDQVLGAKLVGAGDHQGADLVPRDDGEEPFGDVLEEHQDRVALADADPPKHVPDAVGDPAHFPEGISRLVPLGVFIEEGELGPVLRVPVDDVPAEVEVVRHVPLEVFHGLVVISDVSHCRMPPPGLDVEKKTYRYQRGKSTGGPNGAFAVAGRSIFSLSPRPRGSGCRNPEPRCTGPTRRP